MSKWEQSLLKKQIFFYEHIFFCKNFFQEDGKDDILENVGP